VDATHGVDSLKVVPGIVLELLVAKAQTTVVLVNLKNNNLDVGTNLSELAWVLDFLGPREVADVDKTVNAFLKLYKYTKVGEVANLCIVL
jgi:hypothetical protein